MRKLLIVLAVVAAVLAGWWYASPYWTLHQMQEAAKRGDSQALSAYIDYPAVRENLKSQLRQRMLKDASADGQDGGFAAIGMAFASALINPMIDTLVTPEGVEAAFAERRKDSPPPQQRPTLPKAPDQPVVVHEGLDSFSVHDRKPGSGTFLFKRSGLGWKLVGFGLPESGASS